MVRVCEIFDSVQGEGILMGVPHTFVRLSGCNLSCKWCDTKYAQSADGGEMEPYDVLRETRLLHVCVTGGEPLLQDVGGFFKLLSDKGKKITVETNCTRYDQRLDDFVFMYSVSPKLSSSGEGYDVNVLRSYLKLDTVQFKFVISDDGDFSEVLDIVKKYPEFVRDKVMILQPDGMCTLPMYQKRLRWLSEKMLGNDVLVRNNVRVLPQLHKIVWGKKRGV